MKNLFALIALITTFCIPAGTYAQSFDSGSSTYAVVIGISDYQDKDIPDLRFADRDAEAFANFLTRADGLQVPDENVSLLVNKDATSVKVLVALDMLLEKCQHGDKAIIYFSGHIDVERKILSQPGYLLCADAPDRVYLGGGALPLPFLSDYISALSTNGVKVVFIADVLKQTKHLSGSEIGGPGMVLENLAYQSADEIKLLSCQPSESSLEGEQWGGGHGVFTYHLIQGLSGTADQDGDKTVTLKEIGNYLAKAVPMDTQPMVQNPLTIGNENTVISMLRG